MRHHAKALRRRDQSRLTYGQRYHFLAGWLPWLADSINLIFTLAALGWTIGMLHFPRVIDPPMIILSAVPLAFFVFKMAKMFYLYRSRVRASIPQTLASAVAGLALSHTIAKAMLFGMVTKSLPFFRTPKKVKGRAFWYALQSAREEGLMALALLLGVVTLIKMQGVETPDVLVWIVVLVVQSIAYFAAIAMSIVSAFASLPARLIDTITAPPSAAKTPEATAAEVAEKEQAGEASPN